MCSAALFYCGVPRIVFSILIPCAAQYSLNPPFIYSPPFFDLKHFTFRPFSVSTMAFYFLKVSNTSNLFFQKINPYLLESSIKVMQYLETPRNATEEGPHKLVCTNSNFSAFGVLLVFKKLTFFCFLKIQLSHMSKSMDFNSGNFPFDSSIFIPFLLM